MFLVSSLLGEDFQLDEHIFQTGWFNHQLSCLPTIIFQARHVKFRECIFQGETTSECQWLSSSLSLLQAEIVIKIHTKNSSWESNGLNPSNANPPKMRPHEGLIKGQGFIELMQAFISLEQFGGWNEFWGKIRSHGKNDLPFFWGHGLQ